MSDRHGDLADAWQRCKLILDKLAQCLVLALRGIAQHQLDRDVAAIDLHLAHRFGGREIPTGVGIDQRTHTGLNISLGYRHGELGYTRNKRISLAKNDPARYSDHDRFARM